MERREGIMEVRDCCGSRGGEGYMDEVGGGEEDCSIGGECGSEG